MHERLDQLLQLHGICANELQHLQRNVETYLQSSAKMVAMMQKNWMEVERENGLTLMIYDNIVTCITKIMNSSRKLNIQLQLNNFNEGHRGRENLFEQCEVLNESLEYAIASERTSSSRQVLSENLKNHADSVECQDLGQSSCHVYPLEEICKSKEACDDFVYPKLKLSENYQIGSIVNVLVSYIKSLDDLQFYVLDFESERNQEVCEISQSLDFHQYHNLPPANEVFGLVLDKRIMRAVRSNAAIYDEEEEEKLWPCYLLDFGEIVYSKLSDIKYKLTEKYKSLPASALLCQINDIKASHATPEMLKEMEFKKCTIKIKDILEDIFIVELVLDASATENINANTNGTRLSGKSLPSIKAKIKSNETGYSPTSNSTSQQPILVNNENNLPTSESLNNIKRNTNPFFQTTENSSLETNENGVANGTPLKLSPEELEMLNDEPLNTSNALKAVLGHVPQDDKRLCRFYDPKTGSCFKGSNCKQEHLPLNPEAWTKDVLTAGSIVDKRVPQTVYCKGQILSIIPTYIGELGTFYAQIKDCPFSKRPLVWTDEDLSNCKKLDRPPHVFELVLCRYDDGHWYRAQIVAVDDDFKMFKVFYVDYGNHNVVGIKNLAKCAYELAHIPFQAQRCRLAHLKEIPIPVEKRNAGIQMLCKMLLNQLVKVTVMAHPDDLIVMLVGDLNLTIKSKLVHGGYMKPF